MVGCLSGLRSGQGWPSRTGLTPPGARPGLLAILLLCGGAWPSAAAWAQAPAGERILVIGERDRRLGKPERTVEAADIASYGFGTIGELLGEIAAQDGSADDAVLLVDGRRVRASGAIEDFPVEAVERIEVLGPGDAGRIGASPMARAYNVVLRARTRVVAATAGHRLATEGGWSETSGAGSVTAIARPRRLNISAGGTATGSLRESERDVEQATGAPPGLAAARSLRPSRSGLEATLAASDQVTPWLQASLTARWDQGTSLGRLGLSPAAEPLTQRSRKAGGQADLQLDAEWGSWLLTLGGTYVEQRQRTRTRLASGEREKVQSTFRSRLVDLSANGPLLNLPGGPMRLTIGAEWSRDGLDSSVRGSSGSFNQTMREARGALDLPIAGRQTGFLAPLGDLSLGVELRRGRRSGSGATSTDTLSMRWQPARWLRVFASESRSKSPPSVTLLSQPPVETPAVRYFDPLIGESVDVVTITGGNPDLVPARLVDRRLSVQVRPLRDIDLALSADYNLVRSRNAPAILPSASLAVVAAFPERFGRDAGGALVRVDQRPVSLAEQEEQQLRYGINLTVPLSGLGPGRPDAPRAGRVQLTVSHTILLDSSLRLRSGTDRIDLLSRDSVGFGSGSKPRHQFDATIGYAERGLGVRIKVERRSASFLDISGLEGVNVLRFQPLTTLDLRAFAEGSRLLRGVGWLKGTRFSLAAVNLTNSRERVRDESGVTPLSYQPAYRDPTGRTIELEFRKAF